MEIKKLISKLEYANTKIKLMKSEARKKNYYHYQHFFYTGICIAGDYKR